MISAPQRLQQQQTELLDLLSENTINSIALGAYFTRANAQNSFKNTALHTRGLRAYRANAQVLATAALQASYPVLQQLLGEENFRHIAQDFWQAAPPVRGDLAQWGGELAAFVQDHPNLKELLVEHAYMPDVARLEWALHRAATAQDAQLDTASFVRLSEDAPETITLRLSEGCFLQSSAFPTAAIVQLHRPQDAEVHDSTRLIVAQALAAPPSGTSRFHALAWRQGFQPCVRPLSKAEAAMLGALLAQQSLGTALDAAVSSEAHFDFSVWLQAQVAHGLVIGVSSMHV